MKMRALLVGAVLVVGCGPSQDEVNQAFLDAAAAEPGAIRTESGLIYLERVTGTGVQPLSGERVEVHYTGSFTDGDVFDTSADRGPLSIGLWEVIPCWTQGIPLMKEGGEATLTCPPQLAYGPDGIPGRIPGNAVLQFEVSLLNVVGR